MVSDKELYDLLKSFLESCDEGDDDEDNEEEVGTSEGVKVDASDGVAVDEVEESTVSGLTCDDTSLVKRQAIVQKVELLKKALAKKKYSKPRMVSTDIRESFGIMFANTWNSCDLSVMRGMCEKYYMPDLAVTIRKQINQQPDLFTTKGIGPKFIANMMYSASVLSPDVTNKLRNTLFNTTSGEVAFTFYYISSKVYNVPSILEALPSLTGGKEQAEGVTAATKLSDDAMVQVLERIKHNLPLRKNPIKVVCRCVVKMVTNPQKRVQSLKMSVYNVENDFQVEEL